MNSNFKRAIIIGGSKGLGKNIADNLKKAKFSVLACSRKEIDTSDLNTVSKFAKKNKVADVLVLNSGGPPPIKFNKIKIEDWKKYFNQLFLSFFIILNKIKIKKMVIFFIFPHPL